MDLKDAILDALRFSGSIVLAREEVVPRFMIETAAEGTVTLFVPLPDVMAERERRMRLVGGFMAWKGATRFIFSAESIDPDAVLAAGVTAGEVAVAARLILRKPLTLGPIAWLDRQAIGEEIIALLPRRVGSLDAGMVAELERAFGPHGEFKVERPN